MLDLHRTDWLDRAMREANVQTGELADASGVNRSTIQRIRNGQPPRLDTMRSLEKALVLLKGRRDATQRGIAA